MQKPITGPPPTTSKHRYYRTNPIRDLRIAYDFVREHSEIKKLAQKAQYDKNTSNRKFVVGDLVCMGPTAFSSSSKQRYNPQMTSQIPRLMSSSSSNRANNIYRIKVSVITST